MDPLSLDSIGHYSLEWVKRFYEQTGIWWGADPQDEGTHAQRVEIIARLVGSGPLDILDLGTGPGATAAAMADAGHRVTAVEFSASRSAFARQLAAQPHKGSLTVLEADFYTLDLNQQFDLVTYWDGFGVGTDADQRRLLVRVAREWLKPQGCLLMDVFNPFKAALDNGHEEVLEPLPGVDGSVKMINRHYFDPENSRWIDEWQPVDHPDQALAQTLRCYSPVDLQLLLEDTGLEIVHMESEGRLIPLGANLVRKGDSILTDWCYLVKLKKKP
ncbi:MAG TPA: class I SAM-dependent methyltransferase [Anaerolineaceae bacterium]|nr:class I SAM-dependent methyltransferase [Anaerolineaceae bacterium]